MSIQVLLIHHWSYHFPLHYQLCIEFRKDLNVLRRVFFHFLLDFVLLIGFPFN